MDDRLDRINAFLRQAAVSADFPGLFAEVCRELLEEGLPLFRATVGYQTLDPVVRARSAVWQRDGGLERQETTHLEGFTQFLRSPIRHLQERNELSGRWRLDRGEGDAFPLLAELRLAGCTDYVMHLVAFDTATLAIPGVALSFTSDRPGGFDEAHLTAFETMVPALGLASCRAALAEISRSVLGVYLGARTARHVLAGEIRRGLGRKIDAAILLADLRGFTRLTDGADPMAVVGWLDEHLDVMAGAVAGHGGEVLKFMGDGMLAVFPVADDGDAPRAACTKALLSAEAARAGNDALNATRRAAGAPALGLDVVLHYGEVIYGNVGSPQRLDFTVIGRAVNEAGRIEALCTTLDRPLLLSSEFAGHCGRPTMSLGEHELRGFATPREIRALP